MANVNEADGVSLSPSERLFIKVVDAFLKARTMSVVIAQCYDISIKPVKWSPRAAEYIVDVEHAAKAAMRDDSELIRVFHRLLTERAVANGMVDRPNQLPDVARELRKRVIRKCAREFQDRELSPGQYFNWTRKRRAA